MSEDSIEIFLEKLVVHHKIACPASPQTKQGLPKILVYYVVHSYG